MSWLLPLLAGVAITLMPATASAAPVWSSPTFLDAGHYQDDSGLVDLACPISTQCVAVDSYGREVSFDPADPRNWTAFPIDGHYALTAVSCAAAAQCVAVDHRGAEITFAPGMLPVDPRRRVIDLGHALLGVACPSIQTCVAVDGSGHALSFNPEASTGGTALMLGGTALTAVQCPSAAQCTAIDDGSSGGLAPLQPERLITFDPQSASVVSVIPLSGTLYVNALSCPTTTACVATGSSDSEVGGQAVGESAIVVSFDPMTSVISSVAIRDAVSYVDVACVSVSLCTAMDRSGDEVSFDPSTSEVLEHTSVDPIGDWPKGFNGSRIACLPVGQCVLATWNNSTAISFAPLSPGRPLPVPIDDGAAGAALACPQSEDCVELANAESEYSPGPVGLAARLDERTENHLGIAAQLPGTAIGFACPDPTQCTAVTTLAGFADDSSGASSSAETFDPATLAGERVHALHGIKIDSLRITALACPTARSCTTVDADGREVTFDPKHPSSRAMRPESSSGLDGLACPLRSQCTAVGQDGVEVTFVPGTGALIGTARIGGSGKLTAVSCPTVSQCSAVDQRGRELTFDPRGHARPLARRIETAALTGIACPSQRLCIAVSATGEAAVGDPLARGGWLVRPVPGASSLVTVACSSSLTCTAADSAGETFETVLGSRG